MDRVIEAAEQVYPGGTECLSFSAEDDGDIAIRENHVGDCPGDPDVAPVIDRFRVISTGELQRFNPIDDSWASY
jgi:hypothetical protein